MRSGIDPCAAITLFLGVGRFRQVVGGAQLDGFNRGGDAGQSREHNDAHGAISLLQTLDQRQPGSTGHLQVDDGKVMSLVFDGHQRLPKFSCGLHGKSAPGHRTCQDFDERGVVVNQQQSRLRCPYRPCPAATAAQAFAVYFPRFPRSAGSADLPLTFRWPCSAVRRTREGGMSERKIAAPKR
jgi:hypothetical protein